MNYDKLLAPAAQEMRPSGIRKFFDLAADMPHCISLGVGEPDFKTPWSIRDAGIRSLEQGRTKYTANAGLKELRAEICQYLARRFDLSYQIDNILVTVGGSEAIDMAIRALVSPGDEVIIPEPCFVCYEPITQLTGGVPVHIATKAEDGFRLTPEALRAAITPRTKLLILIVPQQPDRRGVGTKEAIKDLFACPDVACFRWYAFAWLAMPLIAYAASLYCILWPSVRPLGSNAKHLGAQSMSGSAGGAMLPAPGQPFGGSCQDPPELHLRPPPPASTPPLSRCAPAMMRSKQPDDCDRL